MSRGDLSRVIDAGRTLAALGEAGLAGGLRSLTLDRAWPWRGDGLCVLFLGGPSRRRAWAVLKPPAAGLPGRLRRAAARGALHPLPGLEAWAMPLADDPELAASAALDGAGLAAALGRWLPLAEGEKPRTGLLRYKPLRRLTVEYRAPGGDRVYGKALRARDRQRIEVSCGLLARSVAAAGLALPCGAIEDSDLLLFEHRPGTELDRLIPGPAAGRGVELAGEALAALHRGGCELPAGHPRSREVETLDRWLQVTVRACPEIAQHLGAARGKLVVAAPGVGCGGAVPSHRDFHPGQLLVAPGGITVLDLDTAAMAEPELDAGNFLAHLDLLALGRRSVPAAALARRFRAVYEYEAGRGLSSRRLLWYRAAALLRLACVYRFRPRGSVLGARLVSRCLDLLGSGDVSLEVI